MVEKKEVLKYAGLRAEMAKYGHTRADLAKILNISEVSLSRRFSGAVEWSIGEIDTICRFYDKSYEELFN